MAVEVVTAGCPVTPPEVVVDFCPKRLVAAVDAVVVAAPVLKRPPGVVVG